MKKIILTLMLFSLAALLPGTQILLANVDQEKLQKGLEAYQNEQWDESLNHFQDALIDDPENPQLHFNISAVQYKKQRYEAALESIEKAMVTDDILLQQRAFFNQGNTYYQLEKYQEAVEAYKKALDIQPKDQEAKHNLELVRAKLKEMADKQEQQQDQQQQQMKPSEYAKQLKAQAEILVAQRLYKEALNLMMDGMKSDPTVQAFQNFINRIKNVVTIEEAA